MKLFGEGFGWVTYYYTPKNLKILQPIFFLTNRNIKFVGIILDILLLLRSVMTNRTLNPWYSTKLVVFLRSSGVPQSLVFRAVGSGQKCCRLDMLGQVCRICSGVCSRVCSLSPHSQRAVGWRPIFLIYNQWNQFVQLSAEVLGWMSRITIGIHTCLQLAQRFNMGQCFQ
jgi:hypothetical protein